MQTKRFLVTGGSQALAKRLSALARAAGHEVVLPDARTADHKRGG
jgi:NAD(P)-dependent dehydrogenase (short-subunit alcohol dehydrogenase family)